MSDLIDSATSILVSSERRSQSSAQNIANISTNGYKKQVDFSLLLENPDPALPKTPEIAFAHDFAQGQMIETGGALDLAISGPAFLSLRDGNSLVLSRGGGFTRTDEGQLMAGAGQILQQAGGGDLIVSENDLKILSDGTVLENGLPTGSVALFEAPAEVSIATRGGSVFTADMAAMQPASSSTLRQGFVEKSNVVLSEEMIGMMTAVRQAESGSRVVQIYDQLIGQAITTFSRGSR